MDIKSRKTVYECPIFKIEERKMIIQNKEKMFWVVVRPPNVCVVALTDNHKIILIKEVIKGKECLLLPGGKVEKYGCSEQEIKEQALRELEEETGYHAKNIKLLSKENYPWNTMDRAFYRYIAWNVTDVGQHLEDGEIITVCPVTIKEAEQMIKERKLTSPDEERVLVKALEAFRKEGIL